MPQSSIKSRWKFIWPSFYTWLLKIYLGIFISSNSGPLKCLKSFLFESEISTDQKGECENNILYDLFNDLGITHMYETLEIQK